MRKCFVMKEGKRYDCFFRMFFVYAKPLPPSPFLHGEPAGQFSDACALVEVIETGEVWRVVATDVTFLPYEDIQGGE